MKRHVFRALALAVVAALLPACGEGDSTTYVTSAAPTAPAVVPSGLPALVDLSVAPGLLSPVFDGQKTVYAVSHVQEDAIKIRARAASGITIRVGALTLASGVESDPI